MQGVITLMKSGNKDIFLNNKQSANWSKNHVCKSSMWLLPLQRLPLSCQNNHWWLQASLPLRLICSLCNPLGRENSFQQCHFDPWFLNYLRRYQGLISLFPHGTLWIYQNIIPLDSQINTHLVQYIPSFWTWQLRVFQIAQRYVQAKTIRPPFFW